MDVFFTVDGEEVCDVEAALSELLAAEVLFANGRRYWSPAWEQDPSKPGRLRAVEGQGTLEPETIVLFVGCNDLFQWACADAETLKYGEVGPLYRAWKADGKWGVSRWCCLRRKQRPQAPIERLMRQDGAWDGEMEALPAREQ